MDELERTINVTDMISRTTLWRRVKEGKLVTTKYKDISDTNLDVAVIDLQHCHPKSGQVLLQGLLQARGICVQSHILRDSLKRVDPLLANARWITLILPRTYHAPGPNSCDTVLDLFVNATEQYGLSSRIPSDKGACV